MKKYYFFILFFVICLWLYSTHAATASSPTATPTPTPNYALLQKQIDDLKSQLTALQTKQQFNYVQVYNKGSGHATDINQAATSGVGNLALNVTSNNPDESGQWTTCISKDRGCSKITLVKPLGVDNSKAAGLSIDLVDNDASEKNAAQGIYVKMGSSQNYAIHATDANGQFFTLQRGKLVFVGDVALQNDNKLCLKDTAGAYVCLDAAKLRALLAK